MFVQPCILHENIILPNYTWHTQYIVYTSTVKWKQIHIVRKYKTKLKIPTKVSISLLISQEKFNMFTPVKWNESWWVMCMGCVCTLSVSTYCMVTRQHTWKVSYYLQYLGEFIIKSSIYSQILYRLEIGHSLDLLLVLRETGKMASVPLGDTFLTNIHIVLDKRYWQLSLLCSCC